MSDKQALLQAVSTMPETATLAEMTDALLRVVARRGSVGDFARLYRERLGAEQLAAYLSPKAEVSLASVIAELETRKPAGDAA